MIYLALLFYIALWFPYRTFIVPILPITDLLQLAVFPLLYVVSLGLVYSAAYFVHYYTPDWKKSLRDLIRVRGVKFLSFSTFLAAGIIFVYLLITGGLQNLHIELLLPIAIVSLLNSVKTEIIPGILKDDDSGGIKIRPIKKPDIPADLLRQFIWNHNGQEYRLNVIVRHSIFQEAKAKARVPNNLWAREYVTNGLAGEVRAIANELMQIGRQVGSYDEVSLVLSFVQSAIRYQSDGDIEWPKYPVETLYEEQGDCEDCAILGASILKVMGYDVALLSLPGHIALGVAGAEGIPGEFVEHKDKRYYYCEMTAKGWEIGQMPEKYTIEQIDVYPVPGAIIKIDKTDNA